MASESGLKLHERIGDYLYRVIVLPDGDHFRWTVSHSDMRDGAKTRFAEQIETGTAETEHMAWTNGKAALNRHLVKKYLEAEFPGSTIEEFTGPRRGGRGFRVQNAAVEVSDVFLEDHDSKKVADTLREWGLAKAMRAAGKDKFVEVTTKGLRSDLLRNIEG